jgi:signal transduction histidine kinase
VTGGAGSPHPSSLPRPAGARAAPAAGPRGRPRARELPLPEADRFLLGLRWATLGAALLLAPFGSAQISALPAVFGSAFVLNVAVSMLTAFRRPFATGRPAAVLAIDATQATAATLLAGGAHSPFFPLFLLLAVELAVAFPGRTAVAWIVTAGAAHLGAAILRQGGDWTALDAYMAVGKLFMLLIVGALAVAFTTQVRLEERLRALAERHAAQQLILNELFFQLNEPQDDLQGALGALLSGAQRLLDADVGMVFLCEPILGCWRMTASLGEPEATPTEITPAAWGWRIAADEAFAAGPALGTPLPPGWPEPGTRAVAGIRLQARAGDEPGALVIGRAGGPLDNGEWLALRALAREAELSLRNARLHTEEQVQLARLRQFEEARRSFFSAVAHELRTPLTVLKTLLPSIEDWSRLPVEEQSRAVGMVDQNLGRLESLIGDLLDGAQVEAGAVTLRREPIDLADRVHRIARSLQPLFESRRQQVAVEVEAALPPVSADRRRLDQVLSSLLHNAFKFGRRGGRLRAQLARDGAGVRVCIEDDGPGVPPDARERIFDKFYSVPPAGDSQPGLGLGLYVSRELVALHGGRLWHEPRPGGGSRFCFTLPAAKEGPDGTGGDQNPGH